MNLKKYKSHKTVEAIKINYKDCTFNLNTSNDTAIHTDIYIPIPEGIDKNTDLCTLFARGFPTNDFYLVKYNDDYISWCPAQIFEKDYTVLGE